MAGKNLWEINYCDITKLSVLQTRNLEKVQLVPFSLANGRKSHATHHKRELLIPFCNIYLASLKQLHCKGDSCREILSSKQRNCNFAYLSCYSWKLFHFHILRAPYTYIHIYTFSEFNNLLFVIDMSIWQIVIPMQLCIFFSYLHCLSNTILYAPKANCLV